MPSAEQQGRQDRVGSLGISVDDSAPTRGVLTLTGELDLASAGAVATCLTALVNDGKDVVVDMTGLQFIDSSGLGALITAHVRAVREGRAITLRSPGHNVAKVIRITGLDNVLRIEE